MPIRAVPKAGGAATTLYPIPFTSTGVTALAADDARLYFSHSGELWSVAKSGDGAAQLVAYPGGQATQVEVDDAWIYWQVANGSLFGLEK